MPTKFDDDSLEAAFNRAVKNAKHLRVRDAPTVAAARALARKIDAWNVIVDWALEDAADTDARPKVPQNDNVSIASFLKYMTALQLIPPEETASKPAKKPEPKSKLDTFRSQMKVV